MSFVHTRTGYVDTPNTSGRHRFAKPECRNRGNLC